MTQEHVGFGCPNVFVVVIFEICQKQLKIAAVFTFSCFITLSLILLF